MSYLRRLAMLVLPVIAVLSLGVPANATSGTAEVRLTVGTSDNVPTSEVTPLAAVSYISNETDIGIGVKGNTNTNPTYDAILPAHRRTDGSPLYWSHGYAFYIGQGYCAVYYYWQNGGWQPPSGLRTPAGGNVRVWVDQSISGETTARWAVRSVSGC